jgi:hypothetical protein
MLDAATAYRTREVTILGSLCRLVLLCPWLDDTYTGLARDLLARTRERGAPGDGGAPE